MTLKPDAWVHFMPDYDGTLIDSVPENHVLLQMTSGDMGFGAEYPFSPEEVRADRAFVHSQEDYYIITRAKMTGRDYKDPDEFRRMKKRWSGFGEKGLHFYRQAREQWERDDPEGRLEKLQFFDGAEDFIKHVYGNPGIEFSILTSNYADNVNRRMGSLLKELGTDEFRVLDRDYGVDERQPGETNPRHWQYRKLKNDRDLNCLRGITLDDMSENLLIGKERGIVSFAVGHGYDLPENFRRHGIRVVTFSEMADYLDRAAERL